jgi:signal transduction histidine kinase
MKVLIVDGVKEERARLVDAFFHSPDIVVVGAVSRLHTALHALGDNPPDVMITDNSLGDDHAAHLIVAARRCVVPPAIVVFSSDDTVEERRRCLEAGADRFVAKASGVAALERAVTDAHGARMLARPSNADRFSLIGRIAAGVAHDLNNYLGVMDVSLTLIGKRLEGEDVEDDVAALREGLERAIRLTSNMTRYARGATPVFGIVDLVAIVHRVLELFQRTLPNEVILATQLEPVPAFEGSEVEVEQLVLNLVLNAADASPQHGAILIRTHCPTPSTVRFEIEDRGPGIGDIIVPDTAVSKSSKREGVGLGLGIVRSIARRHGATLRVHGAEPEGTRVTVDFDVQRKLS